MRSDEKLIFFVTKIFGDGPFLHMIGNRGSEKVRHIERVINSIREELLADKVAEFVDIKLGTLCIARCSLDNCLYRAEIREISKTYENVCLRFIDYGYEETSTIKNLFVINEIKNVALFEIAPQAEEYILAGFINKSQCWDNDFLHILQANFVNREHVCRTVKTTNSKPLIQLISEENTLFLHNILVNNLFPISITEQEVLLNKTISVMNPINNMVLDEEPMSSYNNYKHIPGHQQGVNQPSSNIEKSNGLSKSGLRMPGSKEFINAPAQENGMHKSDRHSLSTSSHNSADSQNYQEPRFFKSRAPLELRSRHMVFVSAIDEGPLMFSVQLLQMQNNLEQLMTKINHSKPSVFTEIPTNGSICLGKNGDSLLYRSVIMGIQSMSCLKLFNVDYGTTELVPFSNIFQIPPEFLHEHIYTYRFALQGLSTKTNYMTEIKEIFSKIARGRIMELEVVPPEGPPIVQYCNLFLDGRNIKDIINDIIKVSYGVPAEVQMPMYTKVKINKGFKHNIMISYIENVSHFYVHLYENKDKLDEIMNKLYIYCQSAPSLSVGDVQMNMPCAALYTEDQIWYRAIIVAKEDNAITVQYVDYGNCEKVDVLSLKYLSPDLILALDAQSVLCSLNGMECIMPNENTTSQLEMLCLEKTITLTVVDYDQGKNCSIVDLVDYNIIPPLNISKRIIELSSPRQKLPANNVEGKDLMIDKRLDLAYTSTRGRPEQVNLMESGNISYPSKTGPGKIAPSCIQQISSHLSGNPQLAEDTVQDNQHRYGKDRNTQEPRDIVTSTKNLMTFVNLDVSNEQKILVSWFINPIHFYCQLKHKAPELTQMMNNIQKQYQKQKHTTFQPSLGEAVIVKYKQDSIFYRGEVIDKKQNNYVIDFVDYGFKNVVPQEDIFPITQSFIEEPKFSIRCKIENILPNKTKAKEISQAWDLFKKDEYDCIFCNKDKKGIMAVDLIYNGEHINSQLVDKGFAIKASEEIKEDIDFTLICGQTIRGKILGVVDFHKFFVKFNGTSSQIECSLYNWNCEQDTQQYIDLKKSFNELVSESNLIIYVNDVQNTKMFVTLYNSVGSKIMHFAADDTYPVISPLCPKTVWRSSMNANISHTETNRVFIQDENDQCLINELLDGLFAFYENEGSSLLLDPCVGSICAAKSEADENWYRAIIIQMSDEGILVKYMDYGNTELLKISSIRELHPNYYEINELCLETIVDDTFKSNSADTISIKLAQIEEGWKITLLNDVVVANGATSNIDVVQESKIIDNEEFEHDTGYVTTDTINADTSIQNTNYVIISHIDSPGQFWIQYQDCIDTLNLMHSELQNVAEKLPSLTNLQIGEKCLAKYSIDSEWYRAEILDADTDITTVRFIDYGNTDVVSNDENIIKEIDGELKSTRPYAKKCSLMALPFEGEEWKEEACQEFEKFADSSDAFLVQVIAENDKRTYVNLTSNEISICDELIKLNYAIPTEEVHEVTDASTACLDSDVVSQKKTGYISHFIDLSEFYVQLECDRPGLEYLETAFADAASFPAVDQITEDMICVAQFDEDYMWYRASITKIMGEEYEVFFIDFGNTAITKEVRELPHSSDNIGQLAKHCSLLVPEEYSARTVEAAKKLKDISADGLTVFDIEFLTLKTPYTVQLYLNGEDIRSTIFAE